MALRPTVNEDPSTVESGFEGLDFIERFGDDAGEALWHAGLALVEQAVVRAREGVWGRYRHYPEGELRRLREDLERGLKLCGEATRLQAVVNGELRALTSREMQDELRERAMRERDVRRP